MSRFRISAAGGRCCLWSSCEKFGADIGPALDGLCEPSNRCDRGVLVRSELQRLRALYRSGLVRSQFFSHEEINLVLRAHDGYHVSHFGISEQNVCAGGCSLHSRNIFVSRSSGGGVMFSKGCAFSGGRDGEAKGSRNSRQLQTETRQEPLPDRCFDFSCRHLVQTCFSCFGLSVITHLNLCTPFQECPSTLPLDLLRRTNLRPALLPKPHRKQFSSCLPLHAQT